MARFRACSLLAALALLLTLSTGAAAQTQLDATEIYLGSAGCRVLTGSGSPESAVTAPVCSIYTRTDSGGGIYRKASGSGNTGWSLIGLPSGMTTGTVLAGGSSDPSWSATPTLTSVTAGTFGSTGDITLDPDGFDVLPQAGYTINLGALTNKYLTLHAAELWVQTLVAQGVMSTIGGRVVVAPTTTLTADLGSGATSMSVKHNELASGDRVLLEANGQVEWIAVTSGASGSGPYSYSITRNLDGSGANNWTAGDAVMNSGTTGDGFIDLYSVAGVVPGSTAGPTIVGNVRTGTTYSQVEPRWAIGNLNGTYGYSSTTYGAAFGSPSAAWVKVDPTNGVRIGHNTTTSVQIDASGNASFAGTVTAGLGAIGGWTIGTASLSATSGTVGLASTVTGGDDVRFWAGDANPGIAEFRVTEAGALFASNATITGSITATSGSFSGALVVDGSLTTTKLVVSGLGAAINADPNVQDQAAWSAGTVTTVTDGKVGNRTLRGPTSSSASPIAVARNPVDAAKTYRVHFWARSAGSANGTFYAGVSTFDSAGVELDQDGIGPPDGSRWYYCATAVAAASITSWTEYNCEFGAGTSKTIPTAARTMAPQALLNLSGSAGYMEIQDFRIEEKSPGSLIVNGTIVANHLAADSVTSAKIAAGTIVASDIASGTITATQIASGTITADRLSVSSLSAISANIGTVTAGTINGVEINFDGGTLNDSDGLAFDNASGDSDFVRSVSWASGALINGQSSILHLRSPGGSPWSQINLGDTFISFWGDTSGGDDGMDLMNVALRPQTNGILSLGTTSLRWEYLFLVETISISSFAGGGTRYVCVDNTGDFYADTTC